MSSGAHQEPIEVEVERLDPVEDEPQQRPPKGAFRGFGPIAAGMILDLADVVTPMGLKRFAVPVGFVVGYSVGVRLDLALKQRLVLGAVGAAYCSLPGTMMLPIGTLVGVLFRAGVFGKK